jgi:hypothetical protein
MPEIKCKECGKSIYLNPYTYSTVNEVGVKCEQCGATNTITLEKGELRKQV